MTATSLSAERIAMIETHYRNASTPGEVAGVLTCVPELLSEIRRLQADNDRLRTECNDAADTDTELLAARARILQFEAALRDARDWIDQDYGIEMIDKIDALLTAATGST